MMHKVPNMKNGGLTTFDEVQDETSNLPFEGAFDTKTQREILEEMLSDPFRPYSPLEISTLLEKQFRTLREAFSNLERLGLIIKEGSDRQRPKYRINVRSNRILALSLYLYGKNDDRYNTRYMLNAMKDHCVKEFPELVCSTYNAIAVDGTVTLHGQFALFTISESPKEEMIKVRSEKVGVTT